METVAYEQPHCPACGRMLENIKEPGKYECKNCGQVVSIKIEKVNKYTIEMM